MPWSDRHIRSWDDFERHIFKPFCTVSSPLARDYVYRGQSKASWNSLRPAFTRLCLSLGFTNEVAVRVEDRILRQFQGKYHMYRRDADGLHENDLPAWWTLMQHYGAPMRVLDWSSSPVVGLYFAVNEDWDEDGALWLFHQGHYVQYLKKSGQDVVDFGAAPKYREVFQRVPAPVPSEMMCLERKKLTERMVAQQCRFTVSVDPLADHAAEIDRVMPEFEETGDGKQGVLRLRWFVDKACKKELLKRLHAMNVTAETLFPGIDGLGDELAETVRLCSE